VVEVRDVVKSFRIGVTASVVVVEITSLDILNEEREKGKKTDLRWSGGVSM